MRNKILEEMSGMTLNCKQYTIDELRIGMTVRASELKSILDVPMVLTDTKVVDGDDVIGTLAFFGDNDKEYEKLFKQSRPITPLYFNSEELEDGIVYDE